MHQAETPSAGPTTTTTDSSDHRRLHQQLVALEQVSTAEVAGPLLNALRLFLQDHFRDEERPGGFFDTVLDETPQQQRAITDLKSQHGAIASSLAELINQLESHQQGSLEAAFKSQLTSLIVSLREHEQQEELLMQDAHGNDLGLGA